MVGTQDPVHPFFVQRVLCTEPIGVKTDIDISLFFTFKPYKGGILIVM